MKQEIQQKGRHFIGILHLLREEGKVIKTSPSHLQMTYFIPAEAIKSPEAHQLRSCMQKTHIDLNVFVEKEKFILDEREMELSTVSSCAN